MENASKALIMAGAVLLALLIISLGVMIYNNYSKTVAENSDLSDQEITSLNSKILPYIGDNISGSKVNALITVVYAMNRNFEGDKIVMNWTDEDGKSGGINAQGDYLSGNTNTKKVKTGKYYKVEIDSYSSAGLINKITIKP